MKIMRCPVAFALLLSLLVACSTIPRGFELTQDQVLVHQASGTVFPEHIGSFSRSHQANYNSEGTDISVNYQSQAPWLCNLDMYVFPSVTANGPIGMRNQHSDFVRSIVRMHPGVVVESDADVLVTQGGQSQHAKQATFIYSGSLGGVREKLFSILVEFEYKRWFLSYRMDTPVAAKGNAPDVLLEFIRVAPLPSKGYTLKTSDFFGLVWTGTPESVRAAITNGANVNAPDKNGKTPLMYAAGYSQDPELITILLDAGAEVNAREPNYGVTPLMFAAAANKSPEAVTLLLNAGADLKAESKGGVTVLMWAVAYNENPEVIVLLLKSGADPKVRNDAGKTAFENAQQIPSLKGTEAYRQLQEASQ